MPEPQPAESRIAGSLMTERLLLRPWCAADAADLYEQARDPRVGSGAGWPAHRSVEESAEVIQTIFAAPETYAVVLRETGRAVGCVGLLFPASSHFPIGPSDAEVGYWIGTPWWGRGLIPEAVRALSRHAFEELGLAALWGSCFVENAASRRVMEKCGFRLVRTEAKLLRDVEGRLRDCEIRQLRHEAWLGE